MAPVDRNLKEFPSEDLHKIIDKIGSLDPSFLVVVQPGKVRERDLYIRSPFRHNEPDDRIHTEMPSNVNAFSLAFPEKNAEESGSEDN